MLVRAGIVSIVLAACGGGSAATNQANQQSAPALEGSGRSADDPVLACHTGDDRSDYAYVAHYTCPDGAMPLQGDLARGASARLGNLGIGPDGHDVHEYEVPCRPHPVRVYVDAYHCGGVYSHDEMRVSPQRLVRLAAAARHFESIPFDPHVDDERRSIVALFREGDQVQLVVCPVIWDRIASAEYSYRMYVRSQFIASLGAGIVETSAAPENRLRNNVLALEGVLRFYAAMLEQAGEAARFAPLDELLQVHADGELPAHVESMLNQCD